MLTNVRETVEGKILSKDGEVNRGACLCPFSRDEVDKVQNPVIDGGFEVRNLFSRIL